MKRKANLTVVAAKPTVRPDKSLDYAEAARLAERGHSNSLADWHRLAELVRKLGANAPRLAKDMAASHARSMTLLANPFGR